MEEWFTISGYPLVGNIELVYLGAVYPCLMMPVKIEWAILIINL